MFIVHMQQASQHSTVMIHNRFTIALRLVQNLKDYAISRLKVSVLAI